MAFDAYLQFTSEATNKAKLQPKGESTIQAGAITLADSWSFGVENKLDISTKTTGGGSGKAEFQEFKIKKSVDTASPDMYLALCAGATFNNVQLVLRKAVGDGDNTGAGKTFLQWTFSMFMIEKIDWSFADPSPEEEVTFKFGALQISYWQQLSTGALASSPLTKEWSQISNGPNMNVGKSS